MHGGLHDKKDRTKDEDDEMLNAAHASAYHWLQLKGHIDDEKWLSSTPQSHNQLANVYVAMKRSEPALYHANRCMELCIERKIGGWLIAFAYQTLALAHHVAGDVDERDKNFRLAEEAGNAIEGEEDRKFFFETLKGTPGYSE